MFKIPLLFRNLRRLKLAYQVCSTPAEKQKKARCEGGSLHDVAWFDSLFDTMKQQLPQKKLFLISLELRVAAWTFWILQRISVGAWQKLLFHFSFKYSRIPFGLKLVNANTIATRSGRMCIPLPAIFCSSWALSKQLVNPYWIIPNYPKFIYFRFNLLQKRDCVGKGTQLQIRDR